MILKVVKGKCKRTEIKQVFMINNEIVVVVKEIHLNDDNKNV